MAAVSWVKRSGGLANKFDPVRIEYSEKDGIAYFAEAYNIDFDITGAFSRRLGFTAVAGVTGNCHSFFNAEQYCIFVHNTALKLLAEDNTVTGIRSGLTSGKIMSYCLNGGAVYYMNGAESGVVINGVSYAYIKPDNTRYPDSTREYSDPPIGSHIRYFAGRMYIADGNVLWYSEPYGPNLFRRAANYIPFAGKIVMVAPVLSGIFVSTVSRIYFLSGKTPKEFTHSVVSQYPAIEGTDVEVDGIAINAGKISALPMQMFTTTQGICVGTAEGQLVNLTYNVLEYPKCTRGCAVFTGKKYIVSLEA